MLVIANNAKIHFLNSCKIDLTKLISVGFGKSEFLNINIFNCYKALYSACNSIVWHPYFIKPTRMILCSFKHGAFVKAGRYVFINTWNTEFYTPLLPRQNKSRLKI